MYGQMDGEFVFYLPGDGWMVTHTEPDQVWTQKVVAWGFDCHGHGVPITTTDDGEAGPANGIGTREHQVWHPDLTPPAFADMDVVNRPPRSDVD